MTWTRLSDTFTDRPDLLACSRSARLLHVEALVWCNRFLTDGSIPRAALPRLTDAEDAEADVAELVAAGLWTSDEGGGWRVDWEDQEPAADVRERKAMRAERQKRYRRRKAAHEAGDHSQCDPRSRCSVNGRVTRNATGNETRNVTGLVTPSPPAPPTPKVGGAGQSRSKAAARCGHGMPIAADGSCCAECASESADGLEATA